MAEEGLGKDMCDAHNNGAEMPHAVDIEEEDSQNLRAVKSLINSMTVFEPSNRPSSSVVCQTMFEISQQQDASEYSGSEV